MIIPRKLANRLRKAGMKVTPQLWMVMWVRYELKGTLSAKQIHRVIKENLYPFIQQDTVEKHLRVIRHYVEIEEVPSQRKQSSRKRPASSRTFGRRIHAGINLASRPVLETAKTGQLEGDLGSAGQRLEILAYGIKQAESLGEAQQARDLYNQLLDSIEEVEPHEQAQLLATAAKRFVNSNIEKSIDLIRRVQSVLGKTAVSDDLRTLLEEIQRGLPEIQGFITATIEGTDIENVLQLGHRYRLVVGISNSYEGNSSETEGTTKEGEFQLIDVRVRTTAIRVLAPGESELCYTRRLIYFPQYGSEPIEFELVPEQIGDQSIDIEFSYERHWLARIQFDVSVVHPNSDAANNTQNLQQQKEHSALDSVLGTPPSTLTIAHSVLPPLSNKDYEVNVQISVRKNSSDYDLEIFAHGQRLEGAKIKIPDNELEARSHRLQAKMQRVAEDCQCVEDIRSLIREGYVTYKNIFRNEDARAVIEALTRNKTCTLEVVSEGFFFPWELLYPQKPEESLSCELFWGMSHIISRAIPRSLFKHFVKPEIPVIERPVIGILTDKQLPQVKDRQIPFFENLEKLAQIELHKLQELNPDGDRNVEESHVSKFLAKSLNIVDFACHALYNDKDPVESYLVLSDEFEFYIDDLRVKDFSFESHPLVILNACETGTISSRFNSGFAKEFSEFGARGVVATECPVLDSFAAAFAEQLYTYLLKGEPIGKSLLDARRFFLREKKDPSGLLYSLYGSPQIRLSREVPNE